MVLWDKVFYEVAREYEGVVEHDKMLVDAMTVRMVNRPESLDVVVATNRKSSSLSVACSALGNLVYNDTDMTTFVKSTQISSRTSLPR